MKAKEWIMKTDVDKAKVTTLLLDPLLVFAGISPKVTSGQGFRPQPMGLCLNGHPANPVRCLFQGPGPDRTSTILRLRPPASPFGPAYIVKGDRK
jgi:hypothetical protein